MVPGFRRDGGYPADILGEKVTNLERGFFLLRGIAFLLNSLPFPSLSQWTGKGLPAEALA
jgi:hypothetical protein